ncbi:MAG TPA: hypothetical protein VNH19_10960 [Candidatus Limnocylindrales bacterium]|nr:hypothetical protein [Candidatus Limnocylindrales bacterium]
MIKSASKLFLTHVGVNLSVSNRITPEQFLNDPQISSVVEKVGGKRMSKRVRIYSKSSPQPNLLYG